MLRLLAYYRRPPLTGIILCCADCVRKTKDQPDPNAPISNPPHASLVDFCSCCQGEGIIDNPTVNECSTS